MTSLHRRGDAEALWLQARATDPPATASQVIVYSKTVSGVSQVFARASDGTVSKLTPGQTVDAVPGSGQSQFRRGGAEVLRFVAQGADPAAVAGQILVYSKLVAGVAQLFTRDSSGTILQITPHLTQATSGGAAGSEVRRGGVEEFAIIARSDDASALAASDVLYSKTVGGVALLFARLSDSTVALISAAPLNTSGTKPNQVFRVSQSGAATWDGNFPLPQDGNYWEYENGGAAAGGQGLNAWQNSPAIGVPTAVRTPLTGEAGWFPNAASFETGISSSGSYTTTRQSSIQLSPTSGLWSHECTFSLPTLSNGTDSYYFVSGFFDQSSNPTLVVNGAYIAYTHGTNGGRFQFVTAANSVRTIVDSGITVNAGYYYHCRVTFNNDGSANFWIKTTYIGSGSWSDDENWGSPITTISTNIPTGSTQLLWASYAILKYAGTNSRMFKAGYQLLYRVPNFTPSGGIIDGTNLQLGAAGTAISVGPGAVPAWISALRTQQPIQWYAYCRGAWEPSVSADYGKEAGGSGANGIETVVALDNGLWGMSAMNTGTATDGYCFYRTSYSLNIDSYTNPMVVETIMEVPVVSTGTQQFKTTYGLFNQASAALTRGITVEVDNSVSTHWQFVVTGPSGTTTVDSGVTCTAGNRYLCRIIVTSTSIDFYLVQDGVTTLTTPTATITTNIPTSVALANGFGVRKIAGSTSRSARYAHLLGYGRSS